MNFLSVCLELILHEYLQVFLLVLMGNCPQLEYGHSVTQQSDDKEINDAMLVSNTGA